MKKKSRKTPWLKYPLCEEDGIRLASFRRIGLFLLYEGVTPNRSWIIWDKKTGLQIGEYKERTRFLWMRHCEPIVSVEPNEVIKIVTRIRATEIAEKLSGK